MAQEDIDVKALLMPRSWDAAIIAVIIGVNGVHELVTARKIETNCKIQKSAMGGQRKLMERRVDGLLCKAIDSDIWRVSSIGVDWRRFSSIGFDFCGGADGVDGNGDGSLGLDVDVGTRWH